MELKDAIIQFLDQPNNQTYCECGYRQCHKLIYCQQCGKEFSKCGHSPKTLKDTMIYMKDKKNKEARHDSRWYSAIGYRKINELMGNKNYWDKNWIDMGEIEKEMLKLMNF